MGIRRILVSLLHSDIDFRGYVTIVIATIGILLSGLSGQGFGNNNIIEESVTVHNSFIPNRFLPNHGYHATPNSSSILNYLVVAPTIVQPESVFRVIVHTFVSVGTGSDSGGRQGSEFQLSVSIIKDGVNIRSSSKTVVVGEMDATELLIPADVTNGTYKLQVHGNHPKSTGGTIFNHQSNLTYSEKFLSILIQTSRHVYNGDSTVRFRCILLQRNLRPYGHPVEVYILDPVGYIMRKWPSVTPKFGVIELSYELPEYSATGYWKVRVEVGDQKEEKAFRVDRYFKHLYEVVVSMPPFILATQENISATILPFFGTEKGVTGNGTLRILAKSRESPNWVLFGTEVFLVDRSYEATWELRHILRSFSIGPYSTHSVLIRVEANVTDFLVGETRSGFAETRVTHQTLLLSFVNPTPLIFKPGLPFHTYLRISYNDHQQLPPEVLELSRIKVVAEAYFESGGRTDFTVLDLGWVSKYDVLRAELGGSEFSYFDLKSKFMDYVKTGLVQVKFKVPRKTNRLILKAEYSDATGNVLSIQRRAYAYFSPTSKYVSVHCTKNPIVVGEYAIFQFKSTFYLEDFHYAVMSKGLILQYGTELLPNSDSLSTTFAIPVSPDMTPGFRVIIYHVTHKGEVLSDMTFVPVNQFSRHGIKFVLNEVKDRAKDSVEAGFLGEAGSYIALSGHRGLRYFLQAGDELSMGGVMEKFYSLEPSSRRINRVRSRGNGVLDQITYLQTSNPALDSTRTFSQSSLHVFTNGRIFDLQQKEECETQERCLSENCFSFINHCGKVEDCGEQFHETHCEDSDEELIEFRINRTNPFIDFYDPVPDGDWAWASGNIGPHGNTYLVLPVPKITDTWYLTAFAVSPSHGFTLIEPVIQYDSTRPFMMTLDAATSVRRGEQLGVQVLLFNNMPKDIFATVILDASPDYDVVKLGATNGNVDEGKIHLVGGEHHHFVWIPAGGQLEVRIPVKPKIQSGSFQVRISAVTQIRSDSGVVEVNVSPEGGAVGKHTSLMLDLKNRATVLKFLNIWVEETPLNPRDPTRKYIYGSPAAHVTLYGDVLGPIFSNIPMSMGDTIGKPGQGTADRLFDLSINIWSLHYLRLTNQLTSGVARKVFVQMNKSLANVMRRLEVNDTTNNNNGSFKIYDNSPPSVWLSAWALQVFMHGTFQDWENFFLVEDRIISDVSSWLIRHQNLDGTFGENDRYQVRPLNRKMHDRTGEAMSGPFNVSLTAHVTIALHLAIPHLDGKIKFEANLAKNRAIQYLEKHLNEVWDPFQAAILTYILTLVDSPEKDAAFSKLFAMRIQEAGFLYWSPEPIPVNQIIYENQRPFIQPKNNEYWDSYAVETTSYALLVCLMRDGVTPYAEQIVTWMNGMKLTDGAFISSLDTAVAFQALAEYSNRARLRDITELSVAIEVSSSGKESSQIIDITPSSIVTVHTVEISDVWGHVNVIARGSGQAVIQLDVSYGVEWDELKDTPPKECFDLRVQEFYSAERNKTSLTIESCFRWTLLEEAMASGTAVLEIEIPSGYGLVMSDALTLVASGIHPTLRDVLVAPGKTSWYFDYIPSEWTCFNHTVRRWYPVANLTASRQASIYEAYALERFQNVIIRDMSLQQLTICHVCGSFQCPYCPYFSGSHSVFQFSSFCSILSSLPLLFSLSSLLLSPPIFTF